MTLETLNQEIIALSSTIATSTEDVPDVSIANSGICSIMKSSPTMEFVYPTWCKYLLEYDLLSASEGKIAGRDGLVGLLSEISDGIIQTIEGREQERIWMVEDAKRNAVINSRIAYIESLGDEIKFCEWADWMADDPFVNVEPVFQEWVPGEEFFGEAEEVSGDVDLPEQEDSSVEEPVVENAVVEMSEERKAEIRAKWTELGDMAKYDVNVEFPVYTDFDKGYSNPYVIENRDDVVVSILQDTAVAEVQKDRDHSDVWGAVSKVLKTLETYNDGTASERGKRHSAALRTVIVRTLPVFVSELVEGCRSVRDYRFAGNDDPVFAKLCGAFKGLIEFKYVSPTMFDYTTLIVIDGGRVITTNTFSLFDI